MGKDPSAEHMCWVKTNSRGYTQPVATKEPNAFGLYDMGGNVYEWTDSADGERRVLRGGSWYHNAHHARSANRFALPPDKRLSFVGFRCVRSIDPRGR
jgi:formylglycine-generating enzyme required for sulfatase activity